MCYIEKTKQLQAVFVLKTHMPLLGALMGLFLWSGALVAALPASAAAPDLPKNFSYTVAMTGYNAVPGQTDDDPTVTASGSYANPEVVAARSRDLKEVLPFGTIIKIEKVGSSTPNCGLHMVAPDIGYRVIADTMHERIRNHVDVLFATDENLAFGDKKMNAANILGSCEGVTITVVGHIDITRPSHLPKTQVELARLVHSSRVVLP